MSNLGLGVIACVIAISAGPFAEKSQAAPAPPRERQQTDQERIARELLRLTRGKYIAPAPLPQISVDAVGQELPHLRFYALVFPQWPVAFAPPAPLSAADVIAVSDGGMVTVMTEPSALLRLFNTNRHMRDPRMILLAWLNLTWHFSDDHFFQFDVGQNITITPQNDRTLATGKDVVQQHGGDQGEIDVSLIIAANGHIIAASDNRNVRAGIRPICQATKLLDPDPIVRGMAEQCLLVMGSAAKPYLDEQRARASPELRAAIDGIWQRIVERENSLRRPPATRPAD